MDNVPTPLTLNTLNEPGSNNDILNTRFSTPLSDAETSELHLVSTPESTKRRNAWSVRLFDEWSQYQYRATNVSKQYRDVLLKPIKFYSVDELFLLVV